MDDLLGRLVEELERRQELERTVLLFTSDNGFLYGEHRLPEKQYAYEESIRVPLEILIPGMPGGRSIDAVVLNNDLAPTFLDLSGISPGFSMDGRSMLPLLAGSTPPPWRQRFLVEHWGSSDRIFDVPTYGAVRTGPDVSSVPGLLYVEYADGIQSPELYDLARDPFQLRSLHDDPSAARRRQEAILRWWLEWLRYCGAGSCQALEFN